MIHLPQLIKQIQQEILALEQAKQRKIGALQLARQLYTDSIQPPAAPAQPDSLPNLTGDWVTDGAGQAST